MIGLQTDLRRQRSDKALPMIGNNNVPFVRIAFLVHLLMWWNTAANDLDAAAISKEAENRAVAATVRIYVKRNCLVHYSQWRKSPRETRGLQKNYNLNGLGSG